MRRVPRMTPTAPPSTPIRNPNTTAGVNLGSTDSRGRTGRTSRSTPFQARIAAIATSRSLVGSSSVSSAPTTAPRIEGGVIHATIRRSTRPSRAWR